MEEELDEEEVEDGEAEDTAPESGMRPSEGTVGQGEDGDDHEEDGDADEASHDVLALVDGLVPGEGSPCSAADTEEHQEEGVRLVEKFQADVVHRSLVDGNKMIGSIGAFRAETDGSFPSHHFCGFLFITVLSPLVSKDLL